MTVTAKELYAVEAQLEHETLMAAKCRAYAQLCQDPELRKQCEVLAGRHLAHYETLRSMLGQEEMS